MTIYEICVIIALFFFAYSCLTIAGVIPKPNWHAIRARMREDEDEAEDEQHKNKAHRHAIYKEVPEKE